MFLSFLIFRLFLFVSCLFLRNFQILKIALIALSKMSCFVCFIPMRSFFYFSKLVGLCFRLFIKMIKFSFCQSFWFHLVKVVILCFLILSESFFFYFTHIIPYDSLSTIHFHFVLNQEFYLLSLFPLSVIPLTLLFPLKARHCAAYKQSGFISVL